MGMGLFEVLLTSAKNCMDPKICKSIEPDYTMEDGNNENYFLATLKSRAYFCQFQGPSTFRQDFGSKNHKGLD